MKKILFAASRVSHVTQFHVPYMRYYNEKGFEVHTIAQGTAQFPFTVVQHDVCFEKSKPLKNIFVINTVRSIIKKEKIDIVITNATLSGLIVRLAVLLLQKKPIVIHSSHGYLFGDSTPRLKRAALICIEKFFAPITAVCIAMNNEDYAAAKKYKLGKHVTFINGMGIPQKNDSLQKESNMPNAPTNGAFSPKEQTEKPFTKTDINAVTPPADFLNTADVSWRQKLGVKRGDFMCLYAAEFSNRKNHAYLIHRIAPLLRKNSTWFLVLSGTGVTLDACKALTDTLGISAQVIFTGFVSPILPLVSACDAIISVSKSEGLPFNIMEAMYQKKPILASNVKGNNDLICDGKTGFLFELSDAAHDASIKNDAFAAHDAASQKNAASPHDAFTAQNESDLNDAATPPPPNDDFSQKLTLLAQNPELRSKLGNAAYEHIQQYTIDAVFKSVCSAYAIADKSLL